MEGDFEIMPFCYVTVVESLSLFKLRSKGMRLNRRKNDTIIHAYKKWSYRKPTSVLHLKLISDTPALVFMAALCL